MTQEIAPHHRRSIRLRQYNYAQEGAYFVTICTHKRQCLLGTIADGVAQLNECGEIVRDEWLRTGTARFNVSMDTFLVMPNHLHGIIFVTGQDIRRGDPAGRPYTRPHGPNPGSVGAMVGQFKSIAAKRINALRHTPGARVWQRNYYEHVVRNEGDLNEIRQYVLNNPAQWDLDEENPDRQQGARRAAPLPGRAEHPLRPGLEQMLQATLKPELWDRPL